MTASENLRAKALAITDNEIVVELADGSRHSAPLTLFPILADATPQERSRWQFIADRSGMYWPEIDEHISVVSIVHPEQTIRMRPEAVARHLQRNQDRRSHTA